SASRAEASHARVHVRAPTPGHRHRAVNRPSIGHFRASSRAARASFSSTAWPARRLAAGKNGDGMTSSRKPALRAAIALGVGFVALGARAWANEAAAPPIALSNVQGPEAARPNERIHVTWRVESKAKVTTEVEWGTRPGELTHTGEGTTTAAKGTHELNARLEAPDHPCT